VCDDEPDEAPKDETQKDDAKTSEKLGYNKFMLEDVWKVRCVRLRKANLNKLRKDARERIQRRRRINRAVMDKVSSESCHSSMTFKQDLIQDQPCGYAT